jgi:hypothetical protein
MNDLGDHNIINRSLKRIGQQLVDEESFDDTVPYVVQYIAYRHGGEGARRFKRGDRNFKFKSISRPTRVDRAVLFTL